MELSLLNESQKQAVLHIDGPLLIIAGPGSGKTRTLVERIVYMIEQRGIAPENILLTTFTERAARELINRISSRLERKNLDLTKMYIGTIHSICLRIIDENIEKSYMRKGYRVLENTDQRFYIYSKLREFKKVDGFDNFFKEGYVLNSWKKAGKLQKWFNKLSEEGVEEEFFKGDGNKAITFLTDAYRRYREFLLEDNYLDFSSIQQEAYRILKENRETLKNIRGTIQYIMIDEYQDTNPIQEKIILMLGGEKNNICVVGDDDQGIYRFRGATIKNILEFEKNFLPEECKKIKLEINYRSSKNIVNFCNDWIRSLHWDGFRHEKNIVANREIELEGASVVKLSVKNSEIQWLERIYKFIFYMKTTGKIQDYNQIAFLFKSVKDKRVITLAKYLENKGIQIYSPRSNLYFYRDEIMDVIGIFLLLFPGIDEIIFEGNIKTDISNYYKSCLNKISKTVAKDESIKSWIEINRLNNSENFERNQSMLEIFYKIISLDMFKKYLNSQNHSIIENRNIYNLGIFSKILENFDKVYPIGNFNFENIETIGKYFFNSHIKYLKEGGIDEYEDIKEFAPKNAVSFLTIHQSKGLEFPIVIIGSLDSIPDRKEQSIDENLEKFFQKNINFEPDYRIKEFDFWRLFYTGFSRAQNLLVLSCVEIDSTQKQVPSSPFKRLYEDLPDIGGGEFNPRELKLEEIKESEIKEKYSFTSHILKYNLCPFRYKMNKIFKFQPKKLLETFYGTLVHQCLEEIHKKILREEVKKINEIDIEKIYFDNYENLSRGERLILKDEILETGLKYIKTYLSENDSILKNIISAEEDISLIYENSILEGKLDLVICEEGKYKIVDFKTGKIPEDMTSHKRQLEIYSYLLHKKSGKKIESGILYYLSSGIKKEVKINSEGIDKTLQEIRQVIDRIEEKTFENKNFDEKKCTKCEFFYCCKE